jgi:hypothetical protein
VYKSSRNPVAGIMFGLQEKLARELATSNKEGEPLF